MGGFVIQRAAMAFLSWTAWRCYVPENLRRVGGVQSGMGEERACADSFCRQQQIRAEREVEPVFDSRYGRGYGISFAAGDGAWSAYAFDGRLRSPQSAEGVQC